MSSVDSVIETQKMKHYLMNIFDFWNLAKSAVGGYIVSFLMPVAPFLIMTVALVLFDVYTGIKAAQKRNEEITSRGIRSFFVKINMYFIAILLSEGMVRAFSVPSQLTYVVAFAICLTEFYSNLENIEKITNVKIVHWIKTIIKFPKLGK